MNTDKPDYSAGLANLRKALRAVRKEVLGGPYTEEHNATIEQKYTSLRLRKRIVESVLYK